MRLFRDETSIVLRSTGDSEGLVAGYGESLRGDGGGDMSGETSGRRRKPKVQPAPSLPGTHTWQTRTEVGVLGQPSAVGIPSGDSMGPGGRVRSTPMG